MGATIGKHCCPVKPLIRPVFNPVVAVKVWHVPNYKRKNQLCGRPEGITNCHISTKNLITKKPSPNIVKQYQTKNIVRTQNLRPDTILAGGPNIFYNS